MKNKWILVALALFLVIPVTLSCRNAVTSTVVSTQTITVTSTQTTTASAPPAASAPTTTGPSGLSGGLYDGTTFSMTGDERMDDAIYWLLSSVWAGQADIDEVLSTAIRIKAGDEDGWYNEWTALATRLINEAENSLAGGHKISAGEAYLRASRYYRTVLAFVADTTAPRPLEAARKKLATYEKAMQLLGYDVTKVEIPYEGTSLPGYFFRSPAAGSKGSVLIYQGGWDSWPEDDFNLIDGAVKRGYHILVFHGPGQGMAMRERGLTYRPDWDKVITPVVNFLASIPGVDSNRIGLMGISFGGMLAPRAAAGEPRIKAVVSNPGLYSYYDFATSVFPPQMMDLVTSGKTEILNSQLTGAMKANPTLNSQLVYAMQVLGAKTPAEVFAKLKPFTLEGFVDKIKAKVLVLDGETDFFGEQPKLLYDALKGPKDYIMFTKATGGANHSRQGAASMLNMRVFDWLDDNLKK